MGTSQNVFQTHEWNQSTVTGFVKTETGLSQHKVHKHSFTNRFSSIHMIVESWHDIIGIHLKMVPEKNHQGKTQQEASMPFQLRLGQTTNYPRNEKEEA